MIAHPAHGHLQLHVKHTKTPGDGLTDQSKGVTGGSRRAVVTDDFSAQHCRAALAVVAGTCPAAVRGPGVSVEAKRAADAVAHVFISRVAFA